MRLAISVPVIALFAAGCMLELSADADHALIDEQVVVDERGLVHSVQRTGEECAEETATLEDQDHGAMWACPPQQWGGNFWCSDPGHGYWVALGCCSPSEVLEENRVTQTCYHNDSSASCLRTVIGDSRCRNISPFTC